MISDARRGHVSPGIYTEEKDVMYSVKSLGITSLGLVGETLYGPAFQNVEVSSWGEFVDYFGGASSEKFNDGKPKYELPYVAKSYLEESNRLNVVRVLGLSGYDAGPAWVLPGNTPTSGVAVVLRSKMQYTDIASNDCEPSSTVNPTEMIDDIEFVKYTQSSYNYDCSTQTYVSDENDSDDSYDSDGSQNDKEIPVNAGKLGIKVTKSGTAVTYNVSLNPADNDYIYNVISDTPEGETLVYIEAVYESNVDLESSFADNWTFKKVTSEHYKDFKEPYRAAETPWIVSEAVISAKTESDGKTFAGKADVRKLFRFITISDGEAANYQIKISIQNIDVKEGSFDVIVRDFYDTDRNPVILETFKRCNLVEGDSNFIAFKIGSSDGGYLAKSKYILVELAEGDNSKAIPAGFMGYPMPTYNISGTVFNIKYNLNYLDEVKPKRQYFGFSDIVGIDSDIFKYKGKEFYKDTPNNLEMTPGFHMDSMIRDDVKVYVDGSEYSFNGVSSANQTYMPRLINAKYIDKTIYKDIKTRKFTVCFYGGFDGWDINRSGRTNTDEFKSTQTKGTNNGFSKFETNNDQNLPLDLPTTAITSDYYAYLAGCRIFSNPQDIDINLFATPGIDWKNNNFLTQEIIDLIEDSEEGRGGDALYIMASPNYDNVEDIVSDFSDSDINTSYGCTYFPWVMYYDSSNKKYLQLPATKDVVKNMASIDNNSYPWFAPAGTERGKVNCVKAVIKTRLSDEDALYNVGINPIKSFAQDGVIVWGNKTTYPVDSPLNRINVRRMMIRVKKLINDAAKHLIFEQHDSTLEKQFKNIVEPILADVKANRGIIDYRVITESTPETRDQHILPAKILIKPTQTLEYISISFTVYPESVQFEE